MDLEDYKTFILGEFEETNERDVQAWKAYHLAAEKVDGHYIIGTIPGKILRIAMQAGYNAMRDVDETMQAKNNHRAKLEALRQLESEGLIISEQEKIRKWRNR